MNTAAINNPNTMQYQDGQRPGVPGNCVRLGRPLRVLVVDDDETCSRLVAGVLRRAGLIVVEADGSAAVVCELERGSRFDAILCDVQMPVWTGIELKRWVGARLPAQAERIILMSSNEELLLEQGLARDEYLVKPFLLAEAIRAVVRVAGEAAEASVDGAVEPIAETLRVPSDPAGPRP
jgi:CheY-like chemotaxis protein